MLRTQRRNPSSIQSLPLRKSHTGFTSHIQAAFTFAHMGQHAQSKEFFTLNPAM